MKKREGIGKRLRETRRSIEMTLKEAAKKAGFRNYQTLAKIEDGKRSVKAMELAILADIYARDISFFLSPSPARYSFSISWRKSKETKKLPIIEQTLKTLLERYLSLEEKFGMKERRPSLPLIVKKHLSYESAAELGEECAKFLGLGKRPALSLSYTLEKDRNIPVFYLKLPGGTSAATISSNDISAICINSNEAPWRRNFDIAHEFFHIIYPSKSDSSCGLNDTTNIEKWANAFASGLLLPTDVVQKFFNRFRTKKELTVLNLVMGANDLGVSTAALVWRIVNLGWIKRIDAEELLQSDILKAQDREIRSQISWESPHLSNHFVSMVFKAVSEGLLSRAKAAEYLMINLANLDTVFLKEGFYTDEDYSIKVPIT